MSGHRCRSRVELSIAIAWLRAWEYGMISVEGVFPPEN